MHKLEKLLLPINESFYWLGFLLSDGHFGKTHLALRLHEKDLNHLKKFEKYFEYEGKTYIYPKIKSVQTNLCGKDIIQKIKLHFNIENRKTYSPPNFQYYDQFSDEEIFCILIGIIDGDGCIHKHKNKNSYKITIKIHKSWLVLLNYFLKRTEDYLDIKLPKAYINPKDYCLVNIGKFEILKTIKEKMSLLNLPVLDRKWNIININLITQYNKSNAKKALFKSLVCQGLTDQEIVKTSILSRYDITYYRALGIV